MVTCRSVENGITSDSTDDLCEMNVGTKPDTVRSCNDGPCPNWNAGGFGSVRIWLITTTSLSVSSHKSFNHTICRQCDPVFQIVFFLSYVLRPKVTSHLIDIYWPVSFEKIVSRTPSKPYMHSCSNEVPRLSIVNLTHASLMRSYVEIQKSKVKYNKIRLSNSCSCREQGTETIFGAFSTQNIPRVQRPNVVQTSRLTSMFLQDVVRNSF